MKALILAVAIGFTGLAQAATDSEVGMSFGMSMSAEGSGDSFYDGRYGNYNDYDNQLTHGNGKGNGRASTGFSWDYNAYAKHKDDDNSVNGWPEGSYPYYK